MIISLKFEKVADTVFDYVITILIWTSSNWNFIVCARVVASGALSVIFLLLLHLNNGDRRSSKSEHKIMKSKQS